MKPGSFLPFLALFLAPLAVQATETPFSLSVGTQTIGGKYQFTDEPLLVETAKVIRGMGSDTLKITVSKWYPETYHIEERDDIQTALDLITREPSYRAVFDMPFRNTMFWLYPFADQYTAFDTGSIPEEEAEGIYEEMYEVTEYLLKKYSGTGRHFWIGNWEGDWHLTKVYDFDVDASPTAIKGAIEWFRLREKAVADAIRETPHEEVYVHFYIEICQVQKAIEEERPAIVNEVLPHIKTDYVSWSSYDTTRRAGELGGERGRRMVFEALDYIEAHLPESDIEGKRVFIGEYGYKHEWVRDPDIQEKYTAELIKWGLEWGCPFILYWQIYCNEFREDLGQHRGFWLINKEGTKLPVWHLHKNFLTKARAWVDAFQDEKGRMPTQEEYLSVAPDWIQLRDEVEPAPPIFGPR